LDLDAAARGYLGQVFSQTSINVAISESQKGRVIEQLVGAALILQSDGALRVSLPLVDDEGIDLVISNRLNDKTLLLQIKSRFGLTGRGRYRADVRRATCMPNPNKYLLFVYYNKDNAAIGDTCWFVPSTCFCQLLSNQRATRPVYVFDSAFTAKADMWSQFRLSVKDLTTEILKALK
jgi:hypothetical protein